MLQSLQHVKRADRRARGDRLDFTHTNAVVVSDRFALPTRRRSPLRHYFPDIRHIVSFTLLAGAHARSTHALTWASSRIRVSRRKYARPAAVWTKGSGAARL